MSEKTATHLDRVIKIDENRRGEIDTATFAAHVIRSVELDETNGYTETNMIQDILNYIKTFKSRNSYTPCIHLYGDGSGGVYLGDFNLVLWNDATEFLSCVNADKIKSLQAKIDIVNDEFARLTKELEELTNHQW